MSGILLKTQDWERVAKQAEFKPNKMASLCSMSERHLQRIFKKYLQCTPGQWLRELQCRLAKELIAQGYSSKAAAAELNFATDAHFCREFKKVFGVSPQNFAPNHLGYLKLTSLEAKRSGGQSVAAARQY
ncbi:MAG TPA: AraC family transcriptional regulator [Candidatus Limnocylindrales bacterium]|jgi:AraC-like DNA-binding protein|nr:AraC family transcriptional regulator [Candidatus Limnocylindrales bacterium]